MPEPTSCCSVLGGYCDRWDLLVGLDGLRVTAVSRDDDGALTVAVEFEPAVMGLIELNRGVARGFRNLENYGLRMLVIGAGLDL